MEGDHCSLLRQVELHFGSSRPVFLVHRLDREASGLMLVAHSREAAARLSHLFQTNQVYKRYQVHVRGRVEAEQGVVDHPLDGKPARTEYALEQYDAERDRSELSVVIHTGRLHQIRRHFDLIGHPVIGDPKHGTDNKSSEGMQLAAVELRFNCPFAQREVAFTLS
jgi:tRNA pseudouridine32 synthase/23S rRNA pseudouridine746 synthase